MRKPFLKLLPFLLGFLVLLVGLWFYPGIASTQGTDLRIVPGSSPNRIEAQVVFPQGDGATPLAFHYLEHLAWLNAIGAEACPADRDTNAWTSSVAAAYWLTGSPEDLTEILARLAGLFKPLDLPRDFAEEERSILLREYEARSQDNPDAQASLAMDAFLYKENRLALSPLGTPQTIAALDYDATRALHGATHRPELARLVVIGDVSERQLRRAMRRAGWPETQGTRPGTAPPPFVLAAPEAAVFRYPEPDATPRLIWRRVVTLREPVPFDLLEAETAFLRDILDTNLPGGLAGPLRFDAAIARGFDIGLGPIDERHIEMSFVAEPDRDVSLAGLQAGFEAALNRISEVGIPEATYARVHERFDDYWPDWSDRDETADWMAGYVLDRVSALREPLAESALKELKPQLTRVAVNDLLGALTTGPARTAAAFIGPKERFE